MDRRADRAAEVGQQPFAPLGDDTEHRGVERARQPLVGPLARARRDQLPRAVRIEPHLEGEPHLDPRAFRRDEPQRALVSIRRKDVDRLGERHDPVHAGGKDALAAERRVDEADAVDRDDPHTGADADRRQHGQRQKDEPSFQSSHVKRPRRPKKETAGARRRPLDPSLAARSVYQRAPNVAP